ncbi:MAG: HD domain-containing protein [Chloroflexota bacterium]|nr:HD domain-containing protein [Chloroflexota bacterium]
MPGYLPGVRYNSGMSATYQDSLWGEIALEEPVLIELVESGPVQRLKGIHQAGASAYLLPGLRTTRYEHSLGVLHVLSRLGAGLEERVAGLLHDVPHTAFSHTVDIVFPSDEHNFHERFQHEVITGSDVPAILERHGVSIKAALEPDRYPLLEAPLPDLCADRIDYSLRDLHSHGKISMDEASHFLEHLLPKPTGIVVDNSEVAEWFARLFREANDLYWTGHMQAGAYWALAGAIRRGYEVGGFTEDDLFSTDAEAMSRLQALDDAEVQAHLSLLTPGTHFYEVEDSAPYFATHMKQRYVDPLVLEHGWDQPRRLSEVSREYRKLVDTFPKGRNVHYKLWTDSMPEVIVQKLAGKRQLKLLHEPAR